jgi:hypothetical protein
MAITTAMCNSFKRELFAGLHAFAASGGNQFKIALYVTAADLSKDTTAYGATNEVSGTGYTAGGGNLTAIDPVLSGDTAYTSFSNFTWASSTITARGCLIYNSTSSNRAVSTHLFDAEKSSSDGDFTVIFPTADATNAILRLV